MRTCCGHCAILYVDVYTLNLATRNIWGAARSSAHTLLEGTRIQNRTSTLDSSEVVSELGVEHKELQAVHEALVSLLFELLSPFGGPADGHGHNDNYERHFDGVEELSCQRPSRTYLTDEEQLSYGLRLYLLIM